MPTYSVNVELPERAAIPDQTFPVTVKALYTFGEAVQGQAIVTFYVWQYGDIIEPMPFEEPMLAVEEAMLPVEEPVRVARQAMQMDRPWWGPQVRRNLFSKIVDINSAAETFEVDILKDLQISSEQFVNVEVVFTESLTKKTAAAIGNIYIAQYAYELLATGSEFYETGVPYAFTVSARRIGTGTPVSLSCKDKQSISKISFHFSGSSKYSYHRSIQSRFLELLL